MILLFQPPECWNYRHLLPYPLHLDSDNTPYVSEQFLSEDVCGLALIVSHCRVELCPS
jgi:hypothetical protein